MPLRLSNPPPGLTRLEGDFAPSRRHLRSWLGGFVQKHGQASFQPIPLRDFGFAVVSGHDFSRADTTYKKSGLQPLSWPFPRATLAKKLTGAEARSEGA